MSGEETHRYRLLLIIFLFLITGMSVECLSLQVDTQVLLQLKSFLEQNNPVNRGRYMEWNQNSSSPCDWPGISCAGNGDRVTGINISDCSISGNMFGNFSALTELSELDLSENTIGGPIPVDLNRCSQLRYLNLSHNLIDGELNLTGLNSLETLDLSINRLNGEMQSIFPGNCNRLIYLDISINRFTGTIDNCFDQCRALQILDLSVNNFYGHIWLGFPRLRQFIVTENNLTGEVPSSIFNEKCNLEVMDLSENQFYGEVPKEVSNCRPLVTLNLWGNNFSGLIPAEIGSLSNLEVLFLGNNKFSREIPESLLNCSRLLYIDLSKNSFGGDIQEIFGRFVQLKLLVLHSNSYTGGLNSSGILRLANISRLDLSVNNISGLLPIEFFEMTSLKFLLFAHNQFSGTIPSEFGNLQQLQTFDLSFNKLTGSIPATIGKLSSLLWLMLANNQLTGEIPQEIGNCTALLWLNLANNQLSGKIPLQLTQIGRNPTPAFESNRRSTDVMACSSDCLTLRRWIPVEYPPFSLQYTLTWKNCKIIWHQLLKGYGIFPICVGGSAVRTLQIAGYLKLTGNRFSGEIPPEIGKMQNFSLFHLGINELSGRIPPEISQLPLVVLNISYNRFSGSIPTEIGNIKCLQNLDLSNNNFSGEFPESLSKLTDLSKFNISYNPLISGTIPSTGQLATFEKESFLGDPLLRVPLFIKQTKQRLPTKSNLDERSRKDNTGLWYVGTSSFLVCGVLSFVICTGTNGVSDRLDHIVLYMYKRIKISKMLLTTSVSGCKSHPGGA